MRKIKVLTLLLVIAAFLVRTNAQIASTSVSNGSGAPVGACVSGSEYINSLNGANYVCSGSVWKVVTAGGIAFVNPSVNITSAIGSAVAQNATKLSSIYISQSIATLSSMGYAIATADNTSNVYDIGFYGPGCLGGATGVPLAFHTGATAGTTLAPSTGAKTIAITGAPVAVNLVPGWYCFANTSSAASPTAVFGGDSVNIHVAMFTHGAAPAGGTGTTSGGVLNATITAPATSVVVEPNPWLAGY